MEKCMSVECYKSGCTAMKREDSVVEDIVMAVYRCKVTKEKRSVLFSTMPECPYRMFFLPLPSSLVQREELHHESVA